MCVGFILCIRYLLLVFCGLIQSLYKSILLHNIVYILSRMFMSYNQLYNIFPTPFTLDSQKKPFTGSSPRTPQNHRRRSPPFWRHHCKCDICSTQCTVRPAAAAAMRPTAICRNRRKYRSPGPDARRPTLANGPIYSCTVRGRSAAAKSRPAQNASMKCKNM